VSVRSGQRDAKQRPAARAQHSIFGVRDRLSICISHAVFCARIAQGNRLPRVPLHFLSYFIVNLLDLHSHARPFCYGGVQVSRAVHQASFLLIFQDAFASLISDLPSGLPDEVSDRVAALGSFTFTTNVDVVLVRWFLQMERFFCVAAADRILLLLRARRFAFLATETMARWSRLRTWSSCSKLLRWRSVQLIHA
jgi:hypothetical protein